MLMIFERDSKKALKNDFADKRPVDIKVHENLCKS